MLQLAHDDAWSHANLACKGNNRLHAPTQPAQLSLVLIWDQHLGCEFIRLDLCKRRSKNPSVKRPIRSVARE